MSSLASDSFTTIDLLRHGSCEDGDIYRGTTDSVLSAKGRREMQRVLAAYSGWHSVVASPLSRCRLVAGEFAAGAGIPLEVEEAFREVDFGDWEGRQVDEVWRDDPEFVSAFYRNPAAVTPPGGEPMLAAQERAVAGWTQLLDRGRGQHHLVVSHGGIIRLLLSHLLQLPMDSITRLHIPHAALARVRVYHSEQGDLPMLVLLDTGGES